MTVKGSKKGPIRTATKEIKARLIDLNVLQENSLEDKVLSSLIEILNKVHLKEGKIPHISAEDAYLCDMLLEIFCVHYTGRIRC